MPVLTDIRIIVGKKSKCLLQATIALLHANKLERNHETSLTLSQTSPGFYVSAVKVF